MRRVFVIATNTFRETIRDRVLGVIVLFALLMIAGSLWLASISLGEEARTMYDFGLVAVTLFGLVVAVFVGASLVHKEVDKRTVFILFSKPVSRGEFIWGKFIGLAGTLFVVVAAMGLFLFLLTWLATSDASGWLWVAVATTYLQLLVVMAATIFFSTVTSSILASTLGLCIYLGGQISHNVLSLSELGRDFATKVGSWLVFVVVPNLNAVDVKAAVVGEATPHMGAIAAWCGYLVAYCVASLLLATVVFRRKEF